MNSSLLPLLLIFVSLWMLCNRGSILIPKQKDLISSLKYIPITFLFLFLGSPAFAEEKKLETLESKLPSIEMPPSVFEENPIYNFGLSVTYEISGSVYKMLSAYNMSPGHMTGYSFEPTNVNTSVDRKTNKVIYTLEGNLNWNFLGITFLSQKKEYQGS